MKHTPFFRKYFLMATVLLFYTQAVLPQTYEEFVKQREAGLQQFARDYENFVQRKQKDYNDFVARRDKEFAAFLSQRWTEYQAFAGRKPEPKPKPREIPEFKKLPQLPPPAQVKLADTKPYQAPEARASTAKPAIRKTENIPLNLKTIQFTFYGTSISVTYDPALTVEVPSSLSNKSFSTFWSNASLASYNHLIDQANDIRDDLGLNDWGFYMLINDISQNMYPHSTNGAAMMKWFLMNRAGYRCRIAYSGNKAVVLLPIMNEVYDVGFMESGGIKYYTIDSKVSKIFTYDKDYPEATRIINLQISRPLDLESNTMEKIIPFQYGTYFKELRLAYNRNSIDFYKDYPQTTMDVYFSAVVSATLKESLAENLLPLLQGRTEWDAVCLLMHLLHTHFPYKTDPEQFGKEKFFFPEEMLFYPYSDCEDRSVFFAYLVKELLNLKTIGLEYDDHIAVAVKFSGEAGGDHVVYNGERYTISDPTYINAPVGQAMPMYAQKTAKPIAVGTTAFDYRNNQEVWNMVMNGGGKRAGNHNDIVTDKAGNTYLSGFYYEKVTLGKHTLQVHNNLPAAFVAKVNPQKEVEWVAQPARQEHAMAYFTALDAKGNIYTAGTFVQAIKFGAETFSTSRYPDLFIAKYDPEGRLLWANRASIDSMNPEMNFVAVISFNPSGKRIGKQIYLEDPRFNQYGISFDASGNIVLTASTYANTGFRTTTATFAAGATFDPIINLKAEYDKLINQKCEPAIAGLFAAINLIKINNVTVPGKAVQAAFDQYNPSFKKYAPTVYTSIGRINFLKNDNGIVLITTDNRKPVTIDYLRINDNSTIKVTEYTTGNVQLDILSGISVGKAIVWYDLNYVKLFRDSGNMVFDYSSDHSQKTYNVKKDLLY